MIGVEDTFPFAARHMIEQQRQTGLCTSWSHGAEIGEILPIERDDMVEAVEVVRCHLACAQMIDAVAVAARLGAGTRIGQTADVPIAGSGGIDGDRQTRAFCLQRKGQFGEWRAADIAEANEQH